MASTFRARLIRNRITQYSTTAFSLKTTELIYGIVEKKTVGASQGGLVHVVFREKGTPLFTGLQMVVNYWLFHNGFSIGIGDTITDSATMAYITPTIADRKGDVSKIIDDATHDRLKASPGMTFANRSRAWSSAS